MAELERQIQKILKYFGEKCLWLGNSSGNDKKWSGHGQILMVKPMGFEDELNCKEGEEFLGYKSKVDI